MPDNTAIRPFQVNFPEAEVTELRRRIAATRWPERELVSDAASRSIWATPTAGDTQGVQLATMQKLIQDEAPRLQPVCRAGRRLGGPHHRTDGADGASGVDRHTHQHAGDN